MAKPVVDRLEDELRDQAQILRINLLGKLGMTLASRYGIRGTPTLLVFDGAGNVVHREAGVPNREAVRAAVAQLAAA